MYFNMLKKLDMNVTLYTVTPCKRSGDTESWVLKLNCIRYTTRSQNTKTPYNFFAKKNLRSDSSSFFWFLRDHLGTID